MNPDLSRAIRHVVSHNDIGRAIHILDLAAAIKWLLPDRELDADAIVEAAETMLLEDPTLRPFAITME